MDLILEQQKICNTYGAKYFETPSYYKIGISKNVGYDIYPLNGLRHPVENGTSGWYLWAGEILSGDHDFFEPLHIEHLTQRCPVLLKYLGLPPGWRFLITAYYEDVWEDFTLLQIL